MWKLSANQWAAPTSRTSPTAETKKVRLVSETKPNAIVDSGATKLVLPEALVKELGLPRGDKIKVRYADGRTAQRRGAEGVYVELLGRHGTFTAVVEPNRDTALLGAIVLEDLDLLVDCPNERVVPRDPHVVVHEIE